MLIRVEPRNDASTAHRREQIFFSLSAAGEADEKITISSGEKNKIFHHQERNYFYNTKQFLPSFSTIIYRHYYVGTAWKRPKKGTIYSFETANVTKMYLSSFFVALAYGDNFWKLSQIKTCNTQREIHKEPWTRITDQFQRAIVWNHKAIFKTVTFPLTFYPLSFRSGRETAAEWKVGKKKSIQP